MRKLFKDYSIPVKDAAVMEQSFPMTLTGAEILMLMHLATTGTHKRNAKEWEELTDEGKATLAGALKTITDPLALAAGKPTLSLDAQRYTVKTTAR